MEELSSCGDSFLLLHTASRPSLTARPGSGIPGEVQLARHQGRVAVQVASILVHEIRMQRYVEFSFCSFLREHGERGAEPHVLSCLSMVAMFAC